MDVVVLSMKNPYKLIEKANNAFNLYLDQYNEIEENMVSSKEEISEIMMFLDSFLEQYNFHQDKFHSIHNKFLDLLQYLINEDTINKKLINSLELQINELSKNSKNNHKNIIDAINESNISHANQRKELDVIFADINDLILNNRNLIGVESEKQLGEIRALSQSVSDGFVGSRNFLSVESEKQLAEIRALGESVSDGFSGSNELIISNSRNQLNELQYIKLELDKLGDINNDLNHAVKLYVDNYNECKRCFFNDNENLLKKYLNTDDLFRICYFNNIKFLSYSPSENKILLQTKDGIIIATNNRFYTIKEVIGFDGYSVPQLYQFDDFIVFDIGMNRAYASLRFALFENCSKVYGFEIDEDTYNKAIYNINLNPFLSNKIIPFNMGLSNKNEIVDLYYLDGADGINTVEEDLVDIQYEMKENKNQIKTKKVEVKKTSEVIGEFIKDNVDSKIVLKIDTEGSEYDIIDDLIESNLIFKIDLIVGEGHRFNDRDLASELSSIGFKEIENKDNNIVYNFAFVKEEFYEIWPLKS